MVKDLVCFVKTNPLLTAIVIFAFIARVFLLSEFPIGITHDELNYIISAKSLFWDGSFAPGTAPAILPINMANFTVTVAEVPVFLLAPFVGPLNLSLFVSRFGGALLGTMTILLVYFLVRELTKNNSFALFSSFLMAINPWSFLLNRTIFEVNFFTVFFLSGLLILLKNRDWKIFWALPLYLLGFFSYTGGQLAFYLFIVCTLVYHYFCFFYPKRIGKPYIVFFLVVTLVLLGYIFVVLHNQSFLSRGGEVYTPFSAEVTKQVDQERKLVVQTPLNSLFINKATVFFTNYFDRYINVFSVSNLFTKGEIRPAFSYQKHGTFYFLDFFFLLFGLVSLFALNKRTWFFLVLVILLSAITSGLSVIEYSYSQRSGLVFPFLLILVGIGVGSFVSLLKSRLGRKVFLSLVVVIYLGLFANLLHMYFYRFPVYAADGWFYHDRLLSRYIQLTQENSPEAKIIVSTFEPKIIFQEYLFYINAYHSDQVSSINQKLDSRDYTYGNVSFINSCLAREDDAIWIYDTSLKCEESPLNNVRIIRFRDVHPVYVIKNDKTCYDQKLGTYVHPSSYQDFRVENQGKDYFCRNWITKF